MRLAVVGRAAVVVLVVVVGIDAVALVAVLGCGAADAPV